ncbi:15579_t:CDS:1 [Dentiscutata heterogama]|uniref:15579_t:CDS:1 n=1 Tax=Dentiscutata heterogama TaxID=1316150 RepID=A0ACA9M8J6_9GLOM|nr:15579_t:CDS:1 [Dentiscutata heterogama]
MSTPSTESPQEGSNNSPQHENSEENETKVSLEDKYYNSQLKKEFNNWSNLQSSLNKYFIVYVTACITSITIGIVFSISDNNTMGSLSKKIISVVISGLGGTVTLLGGLLSFKNLFAKNQSDTVDNLNKEEQKLDIPWPLALKDSDFKKNKLVKMFKHEKEFRTPLYFMKMLAENTKTTLIFVAIWNIIFSCLIIYVNVYSIIITASGEDNDDYRTLIKWLFVCPITSVAFAFVYAYQIKINVPNIVEEEEKEDLHFKDKIPLRMLVVTKNREKNKCCELCECCNFFICCECCGTFIHYCIFIWMIFLGIIFGLILGLIFGLVSFTSYEKDKDKKIWRRVTVTINRIELNQVEMAAIERILQGLTTTTPTTPTDQND